jgi:hypothetical protein
MALYAEDYILAYRAVFIHALITPDIIWANSLSEGMVRYH